MTGEIERLGGDPPSPFEGEFGYSRLVIAGEWVMIGGTTSIDRHGFVRGETPYEQTVEVLGKIRHELERVSSGLEDVVQARVYVTDISRGAEVGRAWSEAMADVRPVMTMVQVGGLFDPRMLVEIEVVARRAG